MTFKNPFKNLKLDAEEQALNDAIESGKVKSLGITNAEKKRLAQYARYTLEKTKNINLRLPERVVQRLKVMAAEQGIPYQTLAGSIIHQYTAKGMVRLAT